MFVFIGVVLLFLCWILITDTSKAHERETGAAGPSRRNFRNIRRNARKKGISEEQAYQEWLAREQRKLRK